MTLAKVLCFLFACASLGRITAEQTHFPQHPGGTLADGGAAMGDSEEAEFGSRAADGAQGQSALDLEAESEAGAHAHGDERSEAAFSSGLEEGEQANSAFDAFVVHHARDYEHGSDEYAMRKALFKQRLAAVHSHNAKATRLWNAAPSKFSDRTEAERARVRGYKKRIVPEPAGNMLQSGESETLQKELAESKDYLHLAVAKDIRDQGSCGSCWAIATISVLEAHYEIYSAKGGKTRSFSAQQMLECIPNPNECGGQGGCEGATVELGMAYTKENGLSTDDETPYLATDGKCSAPSAKDLIKQGHDGASGASFGLMSFATVRSNADHPLAEALAEYGPVAVSASAGSWYEYESGVFDSCEKDTVVDHAITLYGYGKDADQGVKYWLIRNSWGSGWGEKGFIRILRHNHGEKHCGTDSQPLEGLGCKSGPNKSPASVQICGMCGILYDSVVPYFAGSKKHPHSAMTGVKPSQELVTEDTQPKAKVKDDDADDQEADAQDQESKSSVPTPEEMREADDELQTDMADPRTSELLEAPRSKVSSLAISAAAVASAAPVSGGKAEPTPALMRKVQAKRH